MSILRPRLTHWDCPHDPATAFMAMATTGLELQRQQKQESRARRQREQAEEVQEAEQSASARERQAELSGNESQQRALRAARRLGRRGGSRRQLLSGGSTGNRAVGTSTNLAGT